MRSLARRHLVLPGEHGAWIWWIGPLLIGLAAARTWKPDLVLLAAAVFGGFLLRQPATILVKVGSGRRPGHEARPAWVWLTLDLVLLTVAAAALVARGHSRLLILAVPGVIVFGWYLWLVSRREERGQLGVEIVGAGVLALAAPAAYWVSGGEGAVLPSMLWLLCWLQTAASVVLVYFRLSYRKLEVMPPQGVRLGDGRRALLYHGFNAAVASALALGGAVPKLMASAFLLMLLDAIAAVARPPIGRPPKAIGVRQLLLSSLFVVLSVMGFLTF